MFLPVSFSCPQHNEKNLRNFPCVDDVSDLVGSLGGCRGDESLGLLSGEEE